MTIEVYGKPVCPQCTATGRKLTKLELEYEYTDVSVDAAALEFTKDLGYMSAPVVVTRDEDGNILDHWSGFNPGKLDSLAV